VARNEDIKHEEKKEKEKEKRSLGDLVFVRWARFPTRLVDKRLQKQTNRRTAPSNEHVDGLRRHRQQAEWHRDIRPLKVRRLTIIVYIYS
jgi:hypothetical protein